MEEVGKMTSLEMELFRNISKENSTQFIGNMLFELDQFIRLSFVELMDLNESAKQDVKEIYARIVNDGNLRKSFEKKVHAWQAATAGIVMEMNASLSGDVDLRSWNMTSAMDLLFDNLKEKEFSLVSAMDGNYQKVVSEIRKLQRVGSSNETVVLTNIVDGINALLLGTEGLRELQKVLLGNLSSLYEKVDCLLTVETGKQDALSELVDSRKHIEDLIHSGFSNTLSNDYFTQYMDLKSRALAADSNSNDSFQKLTGKIADIGRDVRKYALSVDQISKVVKEQFGLCNSQIISLKDVCASSAVLEKVGEVLAEVQDVSDNRISKAEFDEYKEAMGTKTHDIMEAVNKVLNHMSEIRGSETRVDLIEQWIGVVSKMSIDNDLKSGSSIKLGEFVDEVLGQKKNDLVVDAKFREKEQELRISHYIILGLVIYGLSLTFFSLVMAIWICRAHCRNQVKLGAVNLDMEMKVNGGNRQEEEVDKDAKSNGVLKKPDQTGPGAELPTEP